MIANRRERVWAPCAAVAICAALALASAAHAADSRPNAQTPAKRLFAAHLSPAATMAPMPLGSYAKGCLAGGVRLAETGANYQVMRLGRNRNWGHPALIAFIKRLGEAARNIGWNGILVGDLGQPRGGPMISGHRSHQIGLDVDIWLRPAPARPFTRAEREKVSSWTVVAADRRSLRDNLWTPAHQALLRAAASDPAVARIFVNGAIKARLCADESADPASRRWLRKIRPWWGHKAHFHVRLACPAGAGGCVDQDPPDPGDGCGEVAWWLSDEVLNPKPDPDAPPPKPRPVLTMADLPQACVQVLAAP